jgi:catechol 2,3-dioxygenase-like lactoylglutathione lyase family enzyme
MGVELTKDSVDLGIVVRDAEASLRFYRDVLGLAYKASLPAPGGATMHQLMAGTSMIKLLAFDPPPGASPPPGGIGDATGYRYWTMSVSNLDEIVAGCIEAGHEPRFGPVEIREGVHLAVVTDPDGNLVEFLQMT